MKDNQFKGVVRDLSSEGTGVVDHPDGRIFFVAGTWPGDEGVFEIESIEKRYGIAKLVDLQTPSKHRVTPPCVHQTECGGCPWMFVSYEAQLIFKEKFFENRLRRLGIELDPGVLKPAIASPVSVGYRNRVQLKTDGRKIGFIERAGRDLVDIQDCLVLNDKNRETFKSLRATLPRKDWAPTGKFKYSLIEFDDSMSVNEVLPNLKVKFRQANSAQNFNMRAWVKEKTKSKIGKYGHELFCGDGNFTEILAENKVGLLAAVEMSESAIASLKKKNLLGVQGEALDIFKSQSWKAIKKLVRDPQFVLLDPPREGFPEIQKYIQEFPSIKDVYYISCNPETFLNDMKGLMDVGFKATEILPVDQFPHTPHIELCAVLQRV